MEPSAIDSFFNWNYFDTILQQKEGFSPYVWEDKAADLLRANPKLQIDFNYFKYLSINGNRKFSTLCILNQNRIVYKCSKRNTEDNDPSMGISDA